GTPPELRPRLRRNLACVQLLHRFLRRPDGNGSPPAPARAASVAPAAASPAARAPSPPAETTLGRFQIRRELGRGGFGVVFLALDAHLGREVALKVPRADILVDPELRRRFQHEARMAAGLDHANLVPVYEAGEVGPVCYIASAYCPGITLAGWLKQR